MVALEIILAVLVVGVLVYFFLIAPRVFARPDRTELLKQPYYAHRGLHKNGSDAPENSMLAFQRAVEHGYGIELDVQLTKDRIPVVFHDESLDRVCGVAGNVRDYTFEELQAFPLYGSEQRIPKFADFLAMVENEYRSQRRLDYYADKLGRNVKYLSRHIKEETGHNATDWIDRCVILDAQAQLLSTKKTILEISDTLGFSSQSFFGKYFKRVAGVSPKEYRQNASSRVGLI